MSRHSPIQTLPDPSKVLSGAVKLDLGQLVRLIHSVNPTDRGVSAADLEERYRVKSALQSLLLRLFPASCRVTQETGDDDIVSIRVLDGSSDAGHARISRLDPDARNQVWLMLAHSSPEGPLQPADPAEPRPAPSRGDSLSRGQDALAEYDYETARECFIQATEASGGDEPSAGALLGLLVDTLALYPEALAFEPRLSASALRSGGIRSRLALAAAHCGDDRKALELLRGVQDRSARAEVMLQLATLVTDDAERLGSLLGTLRDLDPTNPGIPSLEDRLRFIEAQARRPAEVLLEALAASGDWDAAERKAGEIVSRWPGSEPAKRVLRERSQRREQDELGRILDQARRHLASGDPGAAVDLLQKAPRAAKDHPEVTRILVIAREANTASQEARAIADVERLLSSNRRMGLVAWMGLPRWPADQPGDPALPLLGALKGNLSGHRGEAGVDAVLALEEADRAWRAGDPDLALRIIEPHRDLLRRLPVAQELETEVLKEIQARRARALDRLVESVKQALAANEPSQALALLAQADTRSLGALAQEVVAELERAAQDAAERRGFETRWNDLLERGDLLEARDLAARLAERGEPWPDRLDTSRSRIALTWRMRSFPGDCAWPDLRDHVAFNNLFGPHLWIRDNAQEIWVVDCLDRQVVVRRVSLADSRVNEVCTLRTPEPMGLPTIQEVGGQLWLMDDHWLLILQPPAEGAAEAWEVVTWKSLYSLVDSRDVIEEAVASTGDSKLLLIARNLAGRSRCLIYGAGTWKLEEMLPDRLAVSPLQSLEPGTLLFREPSNMVRLLFKRRSPRWTLIRCGGVRDAAIDADARGFIVLTDDQSIPRTKDAPQTLLWMTDEKGLTGREDLRNAEPHICLMHVEYDGSSTQLKLTHADPKQESRCAQSYRHGLIWVLTTDKAQFGVLQAFVLSSIGFKEAHRANLPRASVLLLHPRGDAIAILFCTRMGWRVQRLEAAAPSLRPGERPDFAGPPHFSPPIHLVRDLIPDDVAEQVLADLVSGIQTRPDIESWADHVCKTAFPDPIRCSALLLTLCETGDVARGDVIVRRVMARPGPLPALLSLACATVVALASRWEEALDWLEAPLSLGTDNPGSLTPDAFNNALFLQGIAYIHVHRFVEGADALRRVDFPGDPIECYRRYVEVLARGPSLQAPDTSSDDWGSQGLRSILHSEAFLQAGQPGSAVEVMDTLPIWLFRDVQAFARLSEAWLLLDPIDDRGILRKTLSLATYLYVRKNEEEDGLHLFLGPYAWDEARLQDICARASAWLDDSGCVHPRVPIPSDITSPNS